MTHFMSLVAKDLRKSYRFSHQTIEVLSGVSLSLHRGESVAICGRSGEGKTTLLHILGYLEAPDSGIIEIGGNCYLPKEAAAIRRRFIGFVFQAFHLLEDLTAIQNVLLPAKIARKAFDRKEGLELLYSVALLEKADFPVKFLSGGERQRVVIARALCNDPQLILADEPSGNLDAANSACIKDLLFSLVKEKNKTLIVATHDSSLADLCDTTYQIEGGKLGRVKK